MTLLEQTEYTSQQFERLQMRSAHFKQKIFDTCTFTDCVFAEAAFNHCKFYDCTFKQCDLSNMHIINCAFVSTRFQNSKLIGVNWTEANWEGISPRKVDFYGSTISYSIFIHLHLSGIHITNCVAHDVEFMEANLTGADCRGTDFAESRFHHTNLTSADFMGARNYSISPLLNIIKKAKFSLPEAVSLLEHLEIVLVRE